MTRGIDPQQLSLCGLWGDTIPPRAFLHNPRYSVVPSPFNNPYQNCTEHTLNVLLAALYGTENMDQLKTNAAAYFTPQTVRLDPVRSLLGPVFVPDFTTRDHKGAIQVVTFTTLKNFMRHYNLTQEDFTLN
ncbi:MAG: DUF2145 domain-containing protein [Nitrospira sp.]|nr:DUF2145 domain-containing protein [Nitrospira sp.]